MALSEAIVSLRALRSTQDKLREAILGSCKDCFVVDVPRNDTSSLT